MITYLQARLTPASTLAVLADHAPASGKVSKAALRSAIRANPRLEMINAGLDGPTYLSVEEVCRHEPGATIELRFNEDRGLAVIETRADGQWVLR